MAEDFDQISSRRLEMAVTASGTRSRALSETARLSCARSEVSPSLSFWNSSGDPLDPDRVWQETKQKRGNTRER